MILSKFRSPRLCSCAAVSLSSASQYKSRCKAISSSAMDARRSFSGFGEGLVRPNIGGRTPVQVSIPKNAPMIVFMLVTEGHVPRRGAAEWDGRMTADSNHAAVRNRKHFGVIAIQRSKLAQQRG